MWARRWPGRKPRHSAELVKAVRADSELEAGLARVTAFARHRDSKERQRQVERIPLDSASSQLADDSVCDVPAEYLIGSTSLGHKINLG